MQRTGAGTGPGLSTVRLGDRIGGESLALTARTLPSPNHALVPLPAPLPALGAPALIRGRRT